MSADRTARTAPRKTDRATTVPVPPLPPKSLAHYRLYDAETADEPVFERVRLKDVVIWPSFGASPWRFDTAALTQCSLDERALPSCCIWDSTLSRCNMSASRVFGAGLLRSEFVDCRATGIQLGESMIKDVTFKNCKLTMASFRACKFQRVVFEGCILDDADFNNATLTDVLFTKCELNRTDFGGITALRMDVTTSNIGAVRGAKSLRHVRIKPEQMIELAPLLCAEIGVYLVE